MLEHQKAQISVYPAAQVESRLTGVLTSSSRADMDDAVLGRQLASLQRYQSNIVANAQIAE
jgi:hypothetical protein